MGEQTRVWGATPWGVDVRPVQVEAQIWEGRDRIQIVGLPPTAAEILRGRVRAAILGSGYELPSRQVFVNLAPHPLRKESCYLDLSVALALLAGAGPVPPGALEHRLVCGELGLDGSLRSVRGGVALAELAEDLEVRELILPPEAASEAAALGGVPVMAFRHLRDIVDYLRGDSVLEPVRPASPTAKPLASVPDLSEVHGQESAKRGLEIAAAGGHNLVVCGPLGTGKTLMARCLPGILPPLTHAESVAVTKIHSIAAEEALSELVTQRPFRAPHTSITTAGLIGGGSTPEPGEVSLAHHGVLFLDDLHDFGREPLAALRQPLEEGVVDLVRHRARFCFPARFALVGAMSPCPCGNLGNPRQVCRCSSSRVDRFQARIPGPLMDRIDLQVEMPAVSLSELRSSSGEPSKSVASRVARARAVQWERFGENAANPVNAAMGPEAVGRFCRLDDRGRRLLDSAYERLGFSARVLHSILKVARTLADLVGQSDIQAGHVAEAISYRSPLRRVDA